MRSSVMTEADKVRLFPRQAGRDRARLEARCAELESVLRDYLIEAHVQSIDGLDECDHDVGVCFCAYHVALDRAVEVLGDPDIARVIQTTRLSPRGEISRSS